MPRQSPSACCATYVMATNKLRPDTAGVWAALEGHPLLKGFILIGGTALTLRIGHRVSEDLGFAYTAPRSLPDLGRRKRKSAPARTVFAGFAGP